MVEKFEDTFIRFDTTHVTDTWTDRQTPHEGKKGKAKWSYIAPLL